MNCVTFPAGFTSYPEARKASAVVELPNAISMPTCTDDSLVSILTSTTTLTYLLLQSSGTADRCIGIVINDVFWSMESLINYAQEYGVLPDHNFTERCKMIAADCGKLCGLNYELFVQRYRKAIHESIDHLPMDIQSQVIMLAEKYGYQDDCEQEQIDGFCIHSFPENCCPMGCDDI